MKAEKGMLIELDMGKMGKNKLIVTRIDQVQKRVFLEHKDTGRKLDMTFEDFTEVTGMEIDMRDLLKG